MRRFIVGLLAVIGALTLALVIVAGGAAWWFIGLWRDAPPLPERIVLELDLRQPLAETPELGAATLIERDRGMTVSELVLALEAATDDPRVAGLLLRLGETDHGFGVAQELRQAIARFREGGGFALAWADSFGEMAPANEAYFIATAADEVHLQPGGMVGLTGLSVETPFVRALLDRIGIEPEIARRKEFKTALDSVAETELRPAHEAMLEALLDSLYGDLAAGIAAGRGLEEAEVVSLIDAGPFTAEEARAAGLVDGLRYDDEVRTAAGDRAGAGAGLVSLRRYQDAITEPAAAPAARVALIRAEGPVVRGAEPLRRQIAADTAAEAIAEAREDAAIDAILLRLDTGGGSAVASETIAREIRRATAAGKPLVVSMGNTAASGGYWIAMGASRIVAQPMTLTGSIGVLAGKPVLAGLWERLDIQWAGIRRGDNADFWSFNHSYSAAARARLDVLLDDVYGRFVAGVAKGRDMMPARVEEIARGRVWTGRQALENGLVDQLGGLDDAQASLRSLLGLAADAALALEPYPPERGLLARVTELMGDPLEMLRTLEALRLQLSAPRTARMPELGVY